MFLLFFLILLTCLFIPHALIYRTCIRFIPLHSKSAKTGLLTALIFLTFSYILTAAGFRLFERPILAKLHYLSSLWLGLFIYLFLACMLAWLLAGVAKLLGRTFPMRRIALGLFVLACVYTGAGLWAAHTPVLTAIHVALPGLPLAWKGKTIVQLSDVHLGPINTPHFLDRLRKKVAALHPDLILITGDLFDGTGSDCRDFLPGLSALAAEAKQGVFFVTGNHEGYLGLDAPLKVIRQANITILQNEQVNVDGLQIIGISYPETNQLAAVKALFARSGPYRPDLASILLFHTPTNICAAYGSQSEQHRDTYWAPDRRFDFVKSNGIDLQLSGHTHAGQLWPFGYLTRLIFGKVHYGLHQDGDFHIYTSSGTGTWGPPMRTGCRSEIVVLTLK